MNPPKGALAGFPKVSLGGPGGSRQECPMDTRSEMRDKIKAGQEARLRADQPRG